LQYVPLVIRCSIPTIGGNRAGLCEDFAGRVFAFDSAAARVFAKIAAARRGLGRPISHADAQIAALAKVQGAKLATRNVDDFEYCGSGVC